MLARDTSLSPYAVMAYDDDEDEWGSGYGDFEEDEELDDDDEEDDDDDEDDYEEYEEEFGEEEPKPGRKRGDWD